MTISFINATRQGRPEGGNNPPPSSKCPSVGNFLKSEDFFYSWQLILPKWIPLRRPCNQGGGPGSAPYLGPKCWLCHHIIQGIQGKGYRSFIPPHRKFCIGEANISYCLCTRLDFLKLNIFFFNSPPPQKLFLAMALIYTCIIL